MDYETSALQRGAATAASTDETFTARTLERLKMISGSLGEAQADLEMLGARNYGPQPSQSAGAVSKSDAQPSGRFLQIDAMLDRLQEQAASVASLARGHNARI